MQEPKTYEECQKFLQEHTDMEGYKRVLIDKTYYRERVLTHKIDEKNAITFVSLVKDEDEESLEAFTTKAAQSIYAAVRAYAGY